MGLGSKDAPKETQQTTERIYALLQTTFKGKEMKTFKQVIEGMNINPNDKEEITATNLHPGHSIKHHYPGKDKKDIPKGYHLMPDGSIMKDSDHPKEEDEIDEGLSPAQKRANRLKRMNTHLRKTTNSTIRHILHTWT